MVTRCTSRPSDRSRRRPLSRTKRPRRTRDGGARRSRQAPPSRLREAAFSGPVRRRRRPTARRNAPPARIRGRPHRRGPRGGGRVDLYAGFCCRRPLPVRRWRPSILACRCRRAHATYPQARASSPRAPAARSCSGRGLPSRRSHLRRWWALTPPFHPYRPASRQAVCFLWHCPAGRPGWLLATALLCGARTFLDPPVSQGYRGRPVGSSAQRTLSSSAPDRLPSAPLGSDADENRRVTPPCARG